MGYLIKAKQNKNKPKRNETEQNLPTLTETKRNLSKCNKQNQNETYKN